MYNYFKNTLDKGGFKVIRNSSTTVKNMFKFVLGMNEKDLDVKDGNIPNFENFKESLAKMQVAHNKCGPDCPHLKRFYEYLGDFQSKMNTKPTFVLHKRTITKLPKIKSVL